MKTVEFMYDFGSPNAYLVHRVLPGIVNRAGAGLRHVPILLGGVFKATNNQSPMSAFADVKHKLAYQMRESQRFVDRHGLQFRMNPHFPVNTLGVMRGAVYAQGKPWENSYIDAVFEAMWVAGEKMDDPQVIERVLQDAELPAAEIMSATQSPEVKAGLIHGTEAAVNRGVFGAPTMFIRDEMFFGKDSLDDLAFELSKPA